MAKSKNSALILVEIKAGSSFHEDFPDHPYRELGQLLSRQRIYRKDQEWSYEDLGVRVGVWRPESKLTARRIAPGPGRDESPAPR